MYLVSLYFDDNSNQILQRYIDKIANATGNDFMIRNNVPPHMTISAIEAIRDDEFKETFNKCGKLGQGKIYIASLGQMLPYVMNVMPVMNEYLTQMIERFYHYFCEIKEQEGVKINISKYYRPYSIMPHITVGKTLTEEQMKIAFEIMQKNFQPFEATITEIGLSKTNPYQDIIKIKLD